MTIEIPSRSKDPKSLLEGMASNIDLSIGFWGKRGAVLEISSIFGLWETQVDYPETEGLKGKEKDRRLLDIFYEEMAEKGIQIPRRWKRNILKRYRNP